MMTWSTNLSRSTVNLKELSRDFPQNNRSLAIARINVVLNWFEELKRLVPTN